MISADFIENFVKRGRLVVATVGPEDENHVAVTNGGELVVRLNGQLGDTGGVAAAFEKTKKLNSYQVDRDYMFLMFLNLVFVFQRLFTKCRWQR